MANVPFEKINPADLRHNCYGLRLSNMEYAKLERVAARHGMLRSEFLRYAIDYFCTNRTGGKVDSPTIVINPK